jgi:GDPmannose 4,6-dehydratase
MWMMLQHDTPDDYVLATGETHSVREFIELAFLEAGITIRWEGKGVNEKGIVDRISDAYFAINGNSKEEPLRGRIREGDAVIEVDPRYFRPTEVDLLLGDAGKARRVLGWSPRCTFRELVKEMVESDIRESLRDIHLLNGGYCARKHHE